MASGIGVQQWTGILFRMCSCLSPAFLEWCSGLQIHSNADQDKAHNKDDTVGSIYTPQLQGPQINFELRLLYGWSF